MTNPPAIDPSVRELKELVNKQAEDDGLWFIATTAPESYLQQELRRLHALVEDEFQVFEKMFHDCCVMREALEKIDSSWDEWGDGVMSRDLSLEALSQVSDYPPSFPKDRMIPPTLHISGRPPAVLLQEMEKKGMYISDDARSMAKKIQKPKKETVQLKLVTVRDLGFTESPTTVELFARAKERGLELCPPIVGLELRLQYEDQPMNDWFYVGMVPIAGSDGDPVVFGVGHDEGGLGLYGSWAGPGDRWGLHYSIVFRVGKSFTLKPFDSSSILRRLETLKGEIEKIIQMIPPSK